MITFLVAASCEFHSAVARCEEVLEIDVTVDERAMKSVTYGFKSAQRSRGRRQDDERLLPCAAWRAASFYSIPDEVATKLLQTGRYLVMADMANDPLLRAGCRKCSERVSTQPSRCEFFPASLSLGRENVAIPDQAVLVRARCLILGTLERLFGQRSSQRSI